MPDITRIFQAFVAPAIFVSATALLILSINVRLMGIVRAGGRALAVDLCRRHPDRGVGIFTEWNKWGCLGGIASRP